MEKRFKKMVSWLLIVCMICINIMPAMAAKNVQILTNDETVTRISNPDNEPGQADGLKSGGDRASGYGWAMAERGDYIYIGTWKNTVGAVLSAYILPALKQKKVSSDLFWALVDVVCNGDVAVPTDGCGGEILKMNKNNPGEYETVFESKDGFRSAVVFGDDIYFSAYAALSDNPATIYKVDSEDNVTPVYETYQGSSMRANAILDGKLYFAGTYVPEGTVVKEGHAVLAVIEKHSDDDGWDLVADDSDFGEYCDDPFVNAMASSPVWDMIVFKDELYVSIPGTRGYVIFAGHPAGSGETANEYGWCWREVVGKNNGVNYPGNANNVEEQDFAYDEGGYTGENEAGYLSVAGAFQVFNDELYICDVDHVALAVVNVVGGMIKKFLAPDNYDAVKTWKALYSTMNHPQRMWKLGEDGRFAEAAGFTALMKGTSNEYIWRTAVYDGELYIGTLDSKVFTNYVTPFSCENILDMSAQEWKKEIEYLGRLAKILIGSGTFNDLIGSGLLDNIPGYGLLNDLIELGVFDNVKITEEDIDKAVSRLSSFVEWCDGVNNAFDEMTVSDLMKALVPDKEEVISFLENEKNGSGKIAEEIDMIIKELKTLKDDEPTIRSIPPVLVMTINNIAEGGTKEDVAGLIEIIKMYVITKINDIENEKIDKAAVTKAVNDIDSAKAARVLFPLIIKLASTEAWQKFYPVFSEKWEEICNGGFEGVTFAKAFLESLNTDNEDIPWDDIIDLVDIIYDNSIADDIGAALKSYGSMTVAAFKQLAKEKIKQALDLLDEEDVQNAVAKMHSFLAEQFGMDAAAFKNLLDSIETLDDDSLVAMLQYTIEPMIDVMINKQLEEVDDEKQIMLIERLRTAVKNEISQLTPEQYGTLAKLLKDSMVFVNPKIDYDALKMYFEITKQLRNDAQGFDIIKTSDGVNFETVTVDGFGDKWNYGALRFLPTDEGMYITTANPFYGAQMYLLKHGNDGSDDIEEIDDTKPPYSYADYQGISLEEASEAYDLAHPEYGKLSLDTYPDLIKGTAYTRLVDTTSRFVSEETNDDVPMVYYYSDHFFDFPATEFNPHLNTLSTVLSSASVASHRAEGSDEEKEAGEIDIYKNKSRNVQEMLYKMGFEDIYINDSYMQKPSLDSLGLVIAHKKITDADGNESTLVVLTPRNAGYLDEWYSNFDVGTEGDHKGFRKEAEMAYEELLKYIEDNGITGDIKLWLTGSSRGGAVTNILSGMLNDSDKISALGIEKEDIYSYTTASTRSVYVYDDNGEDKEVHSEKYSNIFNVVYDFDMVAAVMPDIDNDRGWNFERYGQDLVISMGDSADEEDPTYQAFKGYLKEFMMQILVLNPSCTYFGENGTADDYLPLGYKELALSISLSSVPEILDEALNEGIIDDETYMELATEYAAIAEEAGKVINELAGNIGGSLTDDQNVSKIVKDSADFFEKLISKVGAETVASNLLKVTFGEVEDSAETFAHVIKRFNKTLSYAVTRQKYGEKYSDSIALLVDLTEFLDNQAYPEFILNMKDELGGILGDIISSYSALTGKGLPESELLNELIQLEEIAEVEELSTEEKAKVAADLLKKLLFIETTVGSSVKKAADDAEDIDPILAEMLTTDDGRMLVSCLLRLSSASIRFPAAFEFSPLESINTLSSFATAIDFVYATHDEGVFVSFAKVFDSFYELEDSSADNPYSDLNRVTDYEKLGYRTVKLPENYGVKLTVNQLNTSEGSNSKVTNGNVINWNKKDGASGRKDPEVFINTYVDGTDNPTVTYDKGTYLFLPLDHEYEIIITTDKENSFDLPVYEHSLLGSYEVNTVSRVIDSDIKSNESHKDITIYDCDTLIMTAEGFDKDVMAAALYGKDTERASLLIPLTYEEGAAYYPIDIDCSSEFAINGRHNKDAAGQGTKPGDTVPEDIEDQPDDPYPTQGENDPTQGENDPTQGENDPTQGENDPGKKTDETESKNGTDDEGGRPKTGDNFTGLVVILLAASSAGVVFYRKKREDAKPLCSHEDAS